MQPISDETLVQQLAQGDSASLNLLMQRYKNALFRFIVRYVGNPTLAEDLLQETFTKLYFSAATYRSDYRFSTWLFQIAINLCRDYHRRQKIRRFFSLETASETEAETLFSEENPEITVQSEQSVRYIYQAIESLPHKLKTALILFTLEGYSQQECAQLLGVTTKTIETRVYRARKQLEKKISL